MDIRTPPPATPKPGPSRSTGGLPPPEGPVPPPTVGDTVALGPPPPPRPFSPLTTSGVTYGPTPDQPVPHIGDVIEGKTVVGVRTWGREVLVKYSGQDRYFCTAPPAPSRSAGPPTLLPPTPTKKETIWEVIKVVVYRLMSQIKLRH